MAEKQTNPILYARPAPRSHPSSIAAVLLAVLLTPIHFALSMYVGYHLGRGWTSLPWLPVGLFIGHEALISSFMLLGSFIAAFCLSRLVIRLYFGNKVVTGRYHWRVWVVLCGWALWFPVPSSFSLLH
jgi:hypothetical protein